MINPYPDVFTDADVETLITKAIWSRHLAEDSTEIEQKQYISSIERKVHGWFRRCAHGNWLALGLDIVTGGLTSYAGLPTKNGVQLRDDLDKRIENAHECDEPFPDNWTPQLVDLAHTFLNMSDYQLWSFVDAAWLAGQCEFEGQFLAMAADDESGSTLGATISEAFSESVREWCDDIKDVHGGVE